MSQLFPRAANPLAKASIIVGLLLLIAVVYTFNLIYKSPYVNSQNVVQEQPVPFSHNHHVKGLGIDCRYCHTSAETSSFAGIPPVKTCMTCHSQIWTNAKLLEPIRESYKTGKPIKWTKVHALPDYVYFNHSIHVQKGVACVTCHGPVGDMPLMWRNATLEMKWCLSCHRDPEKNIRPKEDVFKVDWQPEPGTDVDELHRSLMKRYHIKKLTDCYVCHR